VELGITAEQLLLEESCHSVANAAAAIGAKPSDFVKNVCLIGDDGRFIVAIVPGELRASRKKVGAALNISMPEIATAEEIVRMTGYQPGGTPSFCYDSQNITVLVDQKLADRGGAIYTGGGSDLSLTRVTVEELIRASGAVIAAISDKQK
jgi:prolyl-tRNA editing enzyme YbaK/EbsC (Cys-tRNA(Pro) deacylase)